MELEIGPLQFVEVLADCPGHTGLLTYRIPPGETIQPGDILSVDFGARQVGAIAVRLTSHLPAELAATQIREVAEVVSSSLFPPGYWELLERVAEYYYTPLMTAIRVAMPPGLLQRSQRRVRLTADEFPEAERLGAAARQVLQLLGKSAAKDYAWSYIQQRVKGAERGLRELRQKDGLKRFYSPPGAPSSPNYSKKSSSWKMRKRP